jgi:membrane dipeptidase
MSLFLALSLSAADEALEKKARDIHDRIWTVDTHVDTPMRLGRGYDLAVSHPFEKRGSGRVDFPRMKAGGLDAIFFALFVGQRPTTPENYALAKDRIIKTFDLLDSEWARWSALVTPATSTADAQSIEKSGKRAIFLGVENGFPLGEDLSLVGEFYRRGARYITLCHTAHNQICDSSTDKEPPRHKGLSAFGRDVVREMNRLGMMIDVSHIADSSVEDVLSLSTAPVIASHSSVRALCDTPRNLSDDLIRKIASKGGVVQICLLSDYIKILPQDERREKAEESLRSRYGRYDKMPKEERAKLEQEWEDLDHLYPRQLATISDLIDHVDHVVKLVGVDYVGFGSDFDGGGGLADCRDVSDFPKLTMELVRRGYSEKDIAKIWGGNLLRVMKGVEDKAAK